MEECWRVLLPEIWLEIMENLSVSDLVSMSLVNRELHAISSTPRLWRSSRIKKIKFKNEFSEFFHITRFRKLRKLSLSRLQLKEDSVKIFFEKFNFFDNLLELDLQGVNLSKTPPEVISNSFKNLRKMFEMLIFIRSCFGQDLKCAFCSLNLIVS